jgi:environmental stress-induced protein Ves
MRHHVKKKASLRVAAWSGGSTTELFIYPDDADLAKRNFEVRVSSATVEAEESVFSSFTGYVRHITPLRGEMRLVHEGHGEITLTPPRTDTFDGEWTTRSYGRCTDFNLIHRPNWRGEIYFADSPLPFSCASNGFTCVYACDATRIGLKSETGELFEVRLDSGDLLVVETEPKEPEKLPQFRVLECSTPPVVATASRL